MVFLLRQKCHTHSSSSSPAFLCLVLSFRCCPLFSPCRCLLFLLVLSLPSTPGSGSCALLIVCSPTPTLISTSSSSSPFFFFFFFLLFFSTVSLPFRSARGRGRRF